MGVLRDLAGIVVAVISGKPTPKRTTKFAQRPGIGANGLPIGSQAGPVPDEVLNARPQPGFAPSPRTEDDGGRQGSAPVPQYRFAPDGTERFNDDGSPIDWKQTSEYLPSDWAKEIFPKDLEGFPPVSIERRRGEAWLVDSVHGRLITPGSMPLQALGIISFNVRGSQHYDEAVASAEPKPLDMLSVVHEPDNPFDKNAMAICALSSTVPLGYTNKANAARLAKRMRAGEKFSAVALRTPGHGDGGFSVVVTDDMTMAHLLRNVT